MGYGAKVTDSHDLADSVAVLDADGAPLAQAPFADGPLQLAGARLTCASAQHGDWQVRAVRVESGDVAGLRLTGSELVTAPHDPVLLTQVDQGVDLCAALGGGDDAVEDHSELRILVPYDAVVDDVRRRDAEYRTTGMPRVTVRDVPAGYPVVVAIRRGAEPPSIPQMEERKAEGAGKPVRVWRTGSSIPMVELNRGPGGLRIDVRWPDRETASIPMD